MTTATYPLTFPADGGVNTQWLTTNGSNQITWCGGDSGKLLQRVSTTTGAVATGSTIINQTNTTPINTDGDQYMSLAITPTSSTSILCIDVNAVWSIGTTSGVSMALFQDSTVNALGAVLYSPTVTVAASLSYLTYYMVAGTTSSTTFKIRLGGGTGVLMTFNGQNSNRIFGGVCNSGIIISEYAP